MKYVLSYYTNGSENWYNLFRVKDNPIPPNEMSYYKGKHDHYYEIENVLVDTNIVIRKENQKIIWAFTEFHYFNSGALYRSNDSNFKIIEFDSDDAALLWFKLNYGG
jgi:hypothetical protein